MTIEHTPGPLAVSNAYGGGTAVWVSPNEGARMVLQGAQCLRAETVKYEEISVDQLQTNARRIVACWNACQNITTESLEENGAASFEQAAELAKVIAEQQLMMKDMLQAFRVFQANPNDPRAHRTALDLFAKIST